MSSNSSLLQVCIATHNGGETKAYSLRLTKGARGRIQEDAVASRLLVKALAEGCGLPEQINELDLRLQPSAPEAASSAGPTERIQVDYERLRLFEHLRTRLDMTGFLSASKKALERQML